MGHVRVYTISDTIGHFQKMRGHQVCQLLFYFILLFCFVSTIPIEAEYALLSQQQLFSGALFQSPESCLALSLLTL